MGRSVFMGKDNWQEYLTDATIDRVVRIPLPDRMGILVLATLMNGRDLACEGQGNGEAVWREFHPVDERLPLDPSINKEVLEWKQYHRNMIQVFWAAPLFDMPLNEETMVFLVKALDKELWQEHYGTCKRGREFKELLEKVSTFFHYPCLTPEWISEQRE